jgi:tRNA(Ile)-lysidine synthase
MVSPGSLRSRFREFSRKHGLFGERDTVIVAISGGIDSMVLLDLLAGERNLTLIVAHVNHGLRGEESDGDEAFVRAHAESRGLAFRTDRPDVAGTASQVGTGIQETARRLRYDFLEIVRLSTGGGKIATGHNLDDNAETILLNLFRGTGVRGLAGIPVRRENIVRPLLFASREEIAAYAADAGIPFREDSSNASDAYARNVVRHHVLPRICEFVSPAAPRNIVRTGDLLRNVAGFLADQTTAALSTCRLSVPSGGVTLSIPRLRELHPFLCREVLLAAAEESGAGGLTGAHIEALAALIDAPPGHRATLPGQRMATRDREVIHLDRETPAAGFCIPVTPGVAYAMEGFHFASTIELGAEDRAVAGENAEEVDADRVGTGGLTLRSWRDGDAFVPLGMSSRKKISNFFVDEKVPAYRKHRIPILATADGEIVWVCGLRIDDRFKVTATTRRVLKLEFHSFTEG